MTKTNATSVKRRAMLAGTIRWPTVAAWAVVCVFSAGFWSQAIRLTELF